MVGLRNGPLAAPRGSDIVANLIPGPFGTLGALRASPLDRGVGLSYLSGGYGSRTRAWGAQLPSRPGGRRLAPRTGTLGRPWQELSQVIRHDAHPESLQGGTASLACKGLGQA